MLLPIHPSGAGRKALLLLSLALVLGLSPAPSAAAPVGRDAAGRVVDTDTLRGRAVLVFEWSTRCAVCMDKWGELRANARGWTGRPFTLVAVNVDDEAVWRDYERAVALVQPHATNIVSLHGQARPQRLPVTTMIDPKGQVVSRVEGRVPAALWDDLADLLP